MRAIDSLTIAVSKGRILTEVIPLFARVNIIADEDPDASRKLILSTNQPGLKLIIVRAADVPTYVEYGAADLGIAGRDVLMEYTGNGVYEPLDLEIARCQMVLAEPKNKTESGERLRVATKYVNTTRNYFAELGKQVEIIKLYGSMELAPLLGLADQIVDLVDTGNTLKANGLVPVAIIADISSRVIVNKASMKMKYQQIRPLLNKLTRLSGNL
jgi:ATP phosphoribosyltransferase